MSTFQDYVDTFDNESGYLNWAAFGPLSPSVREEVFADADLLGNGRPSSLSLVWERVGQAQEVVAELLGGDADDVTLQPSSTHGLMHALYGLSGAVIASTAEFPSVSLTLERASTASDRALTPRWITPDDGRVTPDAVAEALDDEVTALAVSHVDFRTGYRVDLAALREAIGPDRLLIVDAVQSFGVIDVDYSAADVVVGHGYKWLRAGRGSAFAWFSPRARERISPCSPGSPGPRPPACSWTSSPRPRHRPGRTRSAARTPSRRVASRSGCATCATPASPRSRSASPSTSTPCSRSPTATASR
ncbi:aminotransferase class V-fold PLP-dependent enzyme [Microbacterium oxydans]|uniref:aminotransferase class V-fold PLP-dependent enzyme n=1 Tax=Microbacterium oxydans TaxID=82380 RepID=UPI00226B2730|nr:aminotransferase class V-fold PLP-dependent enzyme [Microbacterium oxydans]WAA67267.1 aminotransferase class V-fold PLP-dependent enzyme [Microbacterium oxydans]